MSIQREERIIETIKQEPALTAEKEELGGGGGGGEYLMCMLLAEKLSDLHQSYHYVHHY